MHLDTDFQVSLKEEAMNIDNKNDDDELTEISMKKKKEIAVHHSDICLIHEDKSFLLLDVFQLLILRV